MMLKPRQVNFDETWAQLQETVKIVIVGGQVARGVWNDRFSDVYTLCVCNIEPLNDKLYKTTKEFLEEHVKRKCELVRESGDENLLSVYNNCWEEYSHGCNYLDFLYSYMNREYIKNRRTSDADMNYGGIMFELQDQLLEIGELGLDIWKRLLMEPLKDTIISLLLQEIHTDRCHGAVNQAVLHGVIVSFINVEKYKTKNATKYYEDSFEMPFLKKTGEFYKQESQKLFDQMNCSDYMEKAIQRVDEENMRSRKFLNPTSYGKVTMELQQRLVADHLEALHDECRGLVQKEKRHDLANMYTLLSPIHSGLTVLIQEVEAYIKQTSLNSVKSLPPTDIASTQFVESMLFIHGKYSELVQVVFHADQQFVGALDRACSAAINYRVNSKAPCRAPELLAKYCDGLLKKSVKGMSETEADDKLNSSITIFKYVDDKDIFNKIYARMLARRLIYSQSHSMDAEEAMINRLKQACGYEFTNKLHRMFTDMTISNDLNSKFTAFLKQEDDVNDLGIGFTIRVLQAGAWPVDASNIPTFALPQELEKSVRTFEAFYMKNFNGRKLTWIHTFCHAEVKLNYLKRTYFVTMGTYLMSLLLLFNNSTSINFRELADATQLQEKELVRNLQLLVDSKLLSIEGEEINEETIFNLNTQYNNKRNKFRMLAAQKDNVQEMEQTHSAVDEDRKLYLQAAIVRIMKSRKTLKHNLLIQEVLSQSQARFAPSIPMIKKCIEALIDKQYIERTAGTTDEYGYVA